MRGKGKRLASLLLALVMLLSLVSASASPKTGDDARVLPYALAMGLSGLFLLIPVIRSARRNKGRKKA